MEIKNIFRKKFNLESYKNQDDMCMLKLKKMYLLQDKESGIVYTNNKILDKELKNFNDIGITKNKYSDKELIISLTSFPERMKDIKCTLYSLLTQSLKPNKIILWLTESHFQIKKKIYRKMY